MIGRTLSGWKGNSVILAATLLATAQPASAQDVTYADIHESQNHGTVGGIRAYSLGTRTCNISNQSLSWINNGTPAVGFNMYRLSAGRLTQIGMSWVKHACCVSNSSNALCGGTCSSSGFGLRPHCMDTYSASWNSGQGRLGPRSGINPYTSTFAALPGGTGNAIFRRLQVQQSDLSTAGAQYFLDGVYVCAEESMQPTRNNNASYRRCTVNQTTFDLSLQGTTQIGIPAIQAWKDHGLGPNSPDNSVTVDILDIPSEGRYWYAYKVTDLGGGLYRYDYAVYNLNSDRSGGSFTVQIPSGVNITNVGFSAPVYHSGEIYDNTPWSSTVTSNSVVWASPQTFAQNPNTNALRWGTMYNFWFTADQPPVGGTAVLGLFKPHSPQSMSFTVSVPQEGGCISFTGDVNADGKLAGDDIQTFVNCYLVETVQGGCACADLNEDNQVNDEDTAMLIAALLRL